MSVVKSIPHGDDTLQIYDELPNLIEHDNSNGDLITPSFPRKIGILLPSGNIVVYIMMETTNWDGVIENFYWQKERVIKE